MSNQGCVALHGFHADNQIFYAEFSDDKALNTVKSEVIYKGKTYKLVEESEYRKAFDDELDGRA